MSSKELDQIVDVRFNIKCDNPFRTPQDLSKTQQRTNNFYSIIARNPNNFRSVNWIEDSRISRISRFDNVRIFGESVGLKLSNNKKLSFYVSDCLKKTGEKLERGLIPELKSWVDISSVEIKQTPAESMGPGLNVPGVSEKPITNTLNGGSSQENQPEQVKPSYSVGLDDVPPQSMADVIHFDDYSGADMVYKSNDDVTNYDLTPGKQLSYDDLCKLTKAIARSQLTEVVRKDENVLFIEEREKDRIRKNLEKYMGNADIATMYPNLDINALSLKQLQYYSIHIEDYYETLKLMNFMKKGLDMVDLGYTSLFPEGVTMPGGKYKLKLDGTVESVKKVLFDRESPVKIAFKNVQEKYNLHISDEFLLCLNIGAAICSKIHFDKVEEKKENSESSEEESSEEETNKVSPAVGNYDSESE